MGHLASQSASAGFVRSFLITSEHFGSEGDLVCEPIKEVCVPVISRLKLARLWWAGGSSDFGFRDGNTVPYHMYSTTSYFYFQGKGHASSSP